MAVVLYKVENDKVKSIRVDPTRLEAHLSIGWSLERNGKAPNSVEEKAALEKVEIDLINKKENLDPGEVRRLAKEKGIEGWDKKRIGTLVDELTQ